MCLRRGVAIIVFMCILGFSGGPQFDGGNVMREMDGLVYDFGSFGLRFVLVWGTQ